MNKKLKKLNTIIQVCSKCGKVDVYKGDKHICNRDFQEQKRGEE